MNLHPLTDWITFNKSTDLTQFQIKKLHGFADNDSKKVVIRVPLKRVIGNHLLATFFPTICLLTISCLILYIDLAHFEVTIMVSLTAMLVMYTLYQSISDSLPQTGSIKLIDIWIVMGLVIPFMVFLALIIIEIVPDRSFHNCPSGTQLSLRKKESNLKVIIHKQARILIVSITAVFVLCFMTGSLTYFTLN